MLLPCSKRCCARQPRARLRATVRACTDIACASFARRRSCAGGSPLCCEPRDRRRARSHGSRRPRRPSIAPVSSRFPFAARLGFAEQSHRLRRHVCRPRRSARRSVNHPRQAHRRRGQPPGADRVGVKSAFGIMFQAFRIETLYPTLFKRGGLSAPPFYVNDGSGVSSRRSDLKADAPAPICGQQIGQMRVQEHSSPRKKRKNNQA